MLTYLLEELHKQLKFCGATHVFVSIEHVQKMECATSDIPAIKVKRLFWG